MIGSPGKLGHRLALGVGAALLLTASPGSAQTQVDVGVWLPNVGARVSVGSPVYYPAPVYAPAPVYVPQPVYVPAPVYVGQPYPYYYGPGRRVRGWGPPPRAYVYNYPVARAPYRSVGRDRGYYRDVRRAGIDYRQDVRRAQRDYVKDVRRAGRDRGRR